MTRRKHPNLINGKKPEFGNPEHIKYVKELNKIMNGSVNFAEIEWEYCFISDHTTESRKPITKGCDFIKDSNGLRCYIRCPNCLRKHLHTFYTGGYCEEEHYFRLILADESTKLMECYNCGLEWTTIDRLVYVSARSAY